MGGYVHPSTNGSAPTRTHALNIATLPTPPPPAHTHTQYCAQPREDGDWLVRYNEGKRRYVLSVRWQGTGKHFYIWHQPDGMLQLQANHPKFPNLMKLLNYYRTHILCKDAQITLRNPIPNIGVDESDGYVMLTKQLSEASISQQHLWAHTKLVGLAGGCVCVCDYGTVT